MQKKEDKKVIKMRTELFLKAVKENDLETLIYIKEKGYDINKQYYNEALSTKDKTFEIVEHLMSNGAEFYGCGKGYGYNCLTMTEWNMTNTIFKALIEKIKVLEDKIDKLSK